MNVCIVCVAVHNKWQKNILRLLHLKVCMVYVLFFITLAKPKMVELLLFKGKEKTFNVVEHVGTKYMKLGIFLLNDETGVIVEALKKEHLLNADDINMAIISQWLQGKGAQPVAWSTLIDVLRKIGLCTLADDIESGLICRVVQR